MLSRDGDNISIWVHTERPETHLRTGDSHFPDAVFGSRFAFATSSGVARSKRILPPSTSLISSHRTVFPPGMLPMLVKRVQVGQPTSLCLYLTTMPFANGLGA